MKTLRGYIMLVSLGFALFEVFYYEFLRVFETVKGAVIGGLNGAH